MSQTVRGVISRKKGDPVELWLLFHELEKASAPVDGPLAPSAPAIAPSGTALQGSVPPSSVPAAESYTVDGPAGSPEPPVESTIPMHVISVRSDVQVSPKSRVT